MVSGQVEGAGGRTMTFPAIVLILFQYLELLVTVVFAINIFHRYCSRREREAIVDLFLEELQAAFLLLAIDICVPLCDG